MNVDTLEQLDDGLSRYVDTDVGVIVYVTTDESGIATGVSTVPTEDSYRFHK